MNDNTISQSIIEYMGTETHGLTILKKAEVSAEITNWIRIKKKLDSELFRLYQSIDKKENLGRISTKSGTKYDVSSKGLRELYQKYASQKQKISELQGLEAISDHYKKGYRMIHKIREDLTGQEITYSILIKDKGKAMEAHLTLDDILKATVLKYGDIQEYKAEEEVTKSIKLLIRNANIKRSILQKIDQNQKEISNIISELQKPALWDVLTQIHDHQNYGYIYEVYKVLTETEKYKQINYVGKNQRNLEETIYTNLYQKAVANNTPGWQAGDLGSEQLKAVYKSAASLNDVSTIEVTLTNILNALSAPTKEGVIKALRNIFTTQLKEFDNELDKAFADVGNKAFDKLIDEIS